MPHPLLPLLIAAANDSFPPVDGLVTVLPPLGNGWECSVAFTGHAVVATTKSAADIAPRADGFGGSMAPDFLRYLAGPAGFVGVIDVMLVARGTGDSILPLLAGADDHPRVRYAKQIRSNVTVHGDERGLITLADGLAGRREISVEAAEPNAAGAAPSSPPGSASCPGVSWSLPPCLPAMPALSARSLPLASSPSAAKS